MPVVAVAPMTVCAGSLEVAPFTENIARSAALSDGSPAVTPLAATETTRTVTVSVSSTSPTLRVPLAASAASVSVSVSAVLSPPAIVIAGASFTPVMVIVTGRVAMPPLASVTVMV